MVMVIEHLTLNTKPKLGKYKPQNIGKPNLRVIKSTAYKTRGMYLHALWVTWNTKLTGMVIEHFSLHTKPKLGKYKM